MNAFLINGRNITQGDYKLVLRNNSQIVFKRYFPMCKCMAILKIKHILTKIHIKIDFLKDAELSVLSNLSG